MSASACESDDTVMQISPARSTHAVPHASSTSASKSAAPSSSIQENTAHAAASSSSSSSSAPPTKSAVPPKGILKNSVSKKRRSLVWDEHNLDSNEIERIERGPRMKIDEPKTPYQHGRSGGGKSPQQLNLDDGSVSPISTGGKLPSTLSLSGSDHEAMVSEALQRRENEWESSEDERELGKPTTTAGAPHHDQSDHSMAESSDASSHHSTPSRNQDQDADQLSLPQAGDSSSESEELKHKVFESKRKGNYHSMGALLKRKPMVDEDEDEE